MKVLIDLLPVILFFISYKFYGIYIAIYVMIVASVTQVIANKIMHGKYERMQVLGMAAVIVFGGLTLWLRSPEFIMWKGSVINVVFGATLVGSLYIGAKPAMAYLMDKQVALPKQAWAKITLLWGAMFFLIALVNAYYVSIALKARDQLIDFDEGFLGADLATVSCQMDLCLVAQEAEAAWVNFKLFGSYGIILVFLVLTVVYIQQQTKNND